jgi:hypothetical protein
MSSVVYRSSRWTGGNLFFPDTIEILPDGVHYTKARLLGSNEEIINFRHIASVKINNGIFFASVRIDSSGGSVPIKVKGLGKKGARAIRDSISAMQQRSM